MITYRSQMVAYGLSHIATAAVVSGFWWFGLDFAIQEKISLSNSAAWNRGVEHGRDELLDALRQSNAERDELREKVRLFNENSPRSFMR